MKLFDLYLIEWEDSMIGASRWEWLSKRTKRENTRMVSVGFLIKKTSANITIAPYIGNFDADDDDCQVEAPMIIPKGCIISTKKINVRKGLLPKLNAERR